MSTPRGAGAAAPPFESIAIVGVGLIGGSVGLAARARWPGIRVLGVDRREVLREALSLGAITDESTELAAVPGADLVLLAAPVGRNVALLAELAPRLGSATVATDVGSTKRDIVRAAHGQSGAFLGGHPLAGAATPGVSSAREQLFRGRPWILTPTAQTPPELLLRVSEFVQALGALPEVMEADQHDRLMAFVSHLPQLTASALLHTVGQAVGEPGLALSGPGLADTTRLASSPADIWTDILSSNADNVDAALDALARVLGELRTGLHGGYDVARTFASAAGWRRALRLVGEARRGEPLAVAPAPPVRTVPAVRTYLEMTARPPATPFAAEGCRIERVHPCPPEFFRFLYREVGRPWNWLDRLDWTDDVIRRYVARAGLEIWVLYSAGAPAGYFELNREEAGDVEIVYFGLMPDRIGHGLGGPLLSAAIDTAWTGPTRRVWLHTCTLDHSSALPNYLKRGFKPTRTEHYLARVVAQTSQP